MKARKTRKQRNSKEWKEYKNARNICTSHIRFTKDNYWKNKFISSNTPKSFLILVKKYNGNNKNHYWFLDS